MSESNQSNLDIADVPGLSDKEAAKRLKEEGFNEIPAAKHRTHLAIVWEIAREPMIALLLAGGGIYFVLGELQEGVILLGMILVVIGITFYQQNKTERALEALRDLSSPRALVIRDGKQKRIAGREVARGDIIVVSEGDRVPADAMLLSCLNLSIDESLLTGESVPVRKIQWDGVLKADRPGGEDMPFIFSGTLAVKGRGLARVFAVGINTEMGKIGKALKTVEEEQTGVQKEVTKFVRGFAVFGITLCIAVIVLYALTKGDWLQGLLVGIAVAMSMLPEEFPVVLTIYLALGAWRIAQKNVLTRRMPAVEMLGATTVLCVDKTGTITFNRMSVSRLLSAAGDYQIDHNSVNPLPEPFHEMVEYAILSSHKDPFDPMEVAFQDLGQRYLTNTEHLHSGWLWVKEYPLTNKLLATSHVWQSKKDADFVVAVKGAPEAIGELCHFSQEDAVQLSGKIKFLAQNGLRVLGVAKAHFSGQLPADQHEFKFKFMGLMGLADPVRPTVRSSVKECHHAGIRVVMITGDYPETARNIAGQIGLHNYEEVLTGSEIEKMSEAELKKRIKTVNVFARIVPEQKMFLVRALKANGEVVAMTGDGVNDAPALKAAHIGIAMGGRGTDVAREASDMVLLDDDFSSIVKAVRSGRRIFDNMKQAMTFIISVHIPIAALALIPIVFQWPLVLLPVQIVFLELIIDPACSLVFEAEPEEPKIMDRPPRELKESLFSRRAVWFAFIQGFIVAVTSLSVLAISWYRGLGVDDSRTLTFVTLVIGYLGLIIINISWHKRLRHVFISKNIALWYILGGAITFLILVLYVPLLQNLFHFSLLGLADLVIAVAAGSVNLVLFASVKILKRYHIIG